jgi:probable rRNA maturation factor
MNIVGVNVEGMENPAWLDGVETFALKVLEALYFDGWELSILFCADPFIRDLNKRFRDRDEPTDVLSFEQGDDFPRVDEEAAYTAGDIVISLDALDRNVENFSVGREEELKRLIIHGILHLGGMDHSDNSPDQEMLARQELLLKSLSEERIF